MLLSKDKLDLEMFVTMLVEVEGILNRRPLTYASTDVKDYDALTLADFLYPGVVMHSSIQVIPPTPPGGDDLRYAWRKARSLVDQFWKLWLKDYVSSLQSRTRWQTMLPDLRVGQLVLMVDEQRPRDLWKKGQVEETHSDGTHVHSAHVQVTNGGLNMQLCRPLPYSVMPFRMTKFFLVLHIFIKLQNKAKTY